MGMCGLKLFFFGQGGFHILNGVLSKFHQSLTCLYFKLWVVIIFLNELGYHMPCEFLDEAWETGTHSKYDDHDNFYIPSIHREQSFELCNIPMDHLSTVVYMNYYF